MRDETTNTDGTDIKLQFMDLRTQSTIPNHRLTQSDSIPLYKKAATPAASKLNSSSGLTPEPPEMTGVSVLVG